MIRSLIEAIRLVPRNDRLEIDLAGNFAGILAFAASKKKPVSTGDGLQITLVAGERYQRYLQIFRAMIPALARLVRSNPRNAYIYTELGSSPFHGGNMGPNPVGDAG